MATIHIKCDAPGCEWGKVIDIDSVRDWHHRACPVCGAAEIISDGDMKSVALLLAAEAAGVVKINNIGDEPAGAVKVSIDTAGLRKTKEA